jgi:hypothetical protein
MICEKRPIENGRIVTRDGKPATVRAGLAGKIRSDRAGMSETEGRFLTFYHVSRPNET